MEPVAIVWHRILATQPAPSTIGLALSAVTAAVLVWNRALWALARHVVTIAHEGAHGLAAAACGRRLSGIRLHSDSSGVTVSSGRPAGPGMIVTAAAGYVGPALLGLGCAWLLADDHAIAVLWMLLACLALLLLQIRNFFGLWAVLASGAVLYVVSWRLNVQAQVVFAHVVTWFLLLAAPRPVLELEAVRRRGSRGSDADQLARLTPLPALLWVVVFLLVTTGALVLGSAWLLT